MDGKIPSNTLYSWSVPTYTASIVGGFSGTNRPYVVDTLANVSNIPQEAYYTLTPQAGNCVGANFTLTLHIKPVPVINAISMITCSVVPFVVSPTNGTDGLVPSDINYKWDIPTFTGTITGGQNNNGPTFIFGTLRNTTNTIQTATYIVSPYLPPCGWGANFTVTITVLPSAEISSITTVTCSGVPFVITPTSGTHGIVWVSKNIAPYFIYVIDGTRPHIIRARNKKALKTPYGLFKSVKHKGTKANPFVDKGITRMQGDWGNRVSIFEKWLTEV
jgi:hypothetical protein